jgi:hypothetical protein
MRYKVKAIIRLVVFVFSTAFQKASPIAINKKPKKKASMPIKNP